MLKKIPMILIAVTLMALLFAIEAAATTAPAVSDINVTNNLTGTPDTIQVDNVASGDIIKVYSVATGGSPIGVAVSGGASAVVSVYQLGPTAGSVHVSVTNPGGTESTRTAQTYIAELKTTTPTGITAVNNVAGIPDVIDLNTVPGLVATDIIRVYQSQAGATPVAATLNPSDGYVYVNQFGISAGIVFVTVQSTGRIESDRVPVSYLTETSAVVSGTIKVDNNFTGTDDTVLVPGVAAGDTITVYKGATGTATWITKKLVAGDITAGSTTLSIPQLGTGAGKVFVSITILNKAESIRKEVTYKAEPTTAVPISLDVDITNAYSAANDTVDVSGLPAGITVNLYDAAGTLKGTQTETSGGAVTFSLPSTVLNAKGGTLYLTFKSGGSLHESIKKACTYTAEAAAPKLPEDSIQVNNKLGSTQDEVVVTDSNLQAGDKIKIYDVASKLIVSFDVTGSPATIPITNGLNKTGGKIFVTLTTAAAGESYKTTKLYNAEPTSTAPSTGSITVTNNYDTTPDTVLVIDLAEGDVVNVYPSLTEKDPIGTGTVPVLGDEVTVTINAPGLLKTSGRIYVTVTTSGIGESPRTMKEYAAEQAATAPPLNTVTVYNYINASDEVEVSGLTNGDTVNVYTVLTGGNPIGSVTAGALTTERFMLTSNLLSSGGKVYVAISKNGMNESPRTPVPYTSEKTPTPTANKIIAVNNYGTGDSLTVIGAKKDDTINIYTSSIGSETLIMPFVVAADGDASIPIDAFESTGGRIFVSVTAYKKAESTRASITVPSEQVTKEPLVANIKIDNNYNQDDTVTVSGLTGGQTVSVYLTQTALTPAATMIATGTSVTISLPDDGQHLLPGGGKLYVSVKNSSALESKRTMQSYVSEVSLAPKVGNILVINNPGSGNDTVTIIGLLAGDIVTIYDAATDGNVLATQTTTGKGTTIMLNTKLTDTAGAIYVTVTSAGKDESKRVMVSYQAA